MSRNARTGRHHVPAPRLKWSKRLVGRAEFEYAVSSRESDVALRGGVVAATAHTGQLSWNQSLSSQRPELARLRPRAEQD